MSWKLLRAIVISDPLIILATIVMGTLSLFTTFFDSTGKLAHKVAQRWARMLLLFGGVKAKVSGLENIVPNGSYVFAANHQSFMDTPLVMGHIPAQFRFLAKKSLFKFPFIGTHLSRAGHISVDRDDPRVAVKVMSIAAELIRTHGISILIFPEGARTEDGQIHEFLDGAAYLAIKAGVPIVPVSIKGTYEILRIGDINPLAGPASLRVGKPIPTEGMKMKDRGELTRHVAREVAALFEKD